MGAGRRSSHNYYEKADSGVVGGQEGAEGSALNFWLSETLFPVDVVVGKISSKNAKFGAKNPFLENFGAKLKF